MAPVVARVLLPGNATRENAAVLHDISIIYALYTVTAVGFYVLQGSGRLLTCALIVLGSSAITLVLIALGAHAYGLRGAVLGNVGFAMNHALHLTAMWHLGIGWRRWLRWVAVPLLVFASALALEAFLNPSLPGRLALVTVASGVIATWLLWHHRDATSPLLEVRSPSRYARSSNGAKGRTSERAGLCSG